MRLKRLLQIILLELELNLCFIILCFQVSGISNSHTFFSYESEAHCLKLQTLFPSIHQYIARERSCSFLPLYFHSGILPELCFIQRFFKKKKNLYLYHTTCYLARWLNLCVLKKAISTLSSLMPTSLKTNFLLISQMAYGKNTVLMMWGKLF